MDWNFQNICKLLSWVLVSYERKHGYFYWMVAYGWLPEMFHLGMSFLFNTLDIFVEIMLRLRNMFCVFGYLFKCDSIHCCKCFYIPFGNTKFVHFTFSCNIKIYIFNMTFIPLSHKWLLMWRCRVQGYHKTLFVPHAYLALFSIKSFLWGFHQSLLLPHPHYLHILFFLFSIMWIIISCFHFLIITFCSHFVIVIPCSHSLITYIVVHFDMDLHDNKFCLVEFPLSWTMMKVIKIVQRCCLTWMDSEQVLKNMQLKWSRKNKKW